jgi:hypothetical protein
MMALQRQGFTPNRVFANPGWGEASFVKALWPRARLVCLLESCCRTEGGDVGFDPEFAKAGAATALRLRIKNLALLDAMNTMDLGVSPTAWQYSCLPEVFQPKVVEIFAAIDTDAAHAGPAARVTPPAGTTLQAGDPVGTFVSRNLEPCRGHHVFMRAADAAAVLPRSTGLVVGAAGVSYGAAAPLGQSREPMHWDEVRERVDERHMHFRRWPTRWRA